MTLVSKYFLGHCKLNQVIKSSEMVVWACSVSFFYYLGRGAAGAVICASQSWIVTYQVWPLIGVSALILISFRPGVHPIKSNWNWISTCIQVTPFGQWCNWIRLIFSEFSWCILLHFHRVYSCVHIFSVHWLMLMWKAHLELPLCCKYGIPDFNVKA